MEKIIVKAKAKINLGLNVVGKRTDGYHNIETVFYPVNLFDTLTFSPADAYEFSCSDASLSNEKNNSVTKVKEIMERETGKKLNISIHLDKKIPAGAGMGGGSSDAASVLLMLDEIFNLGLSDDKMREIALEIGSDVPFFLHPEPSFAVSRGEILEKINLKIKLPILIVNPGINISTKWAYQNITPRKSRRSLKEILAGGFDLQKIKDLIHNDFEQVVFGKYPLIKKIKEELYETGAVFALMTGSGSTLFGIYENIFDAMKAEKRFMAEYFTFINI